MKTLLALTVLFGGAICGCQMNGKGRAGRLATGWRLLAPVGMLYDKYPVYRLKVKDRDAIIILPDIEGVERALPWVVYHTGAGETCEVIVNTEGEAKASVIKLLLQNGFLVCSITSGAQHWGAPYAEEAHEDLYAYMIETFPVANKVNLLVQSMGGTSGYPWAISHPERVRAIYGIYPITNLPAMGSRNPINNLAPLAKHRVKIMHRHGLEDKAVPFRQNAEEFQDAYRKLGGEIEIIGLPGLGHQSHELFFQPQEVLAFFRGDR